MAHSPLYAARVGPFELSLDNTNVQRDVTVTVHRNQNDCRSIVMSFSLTREVAAGMGQWLVDHSKPKESK